MLLLYTRTYTSHVFLGMLFDVNESRICYFARLRPVVTAVFDIPQNKVTLLEDEIVDLIVDVTEQWTENRKKSGGSGQSGKKRAYTIKTQIITNKKGHSEHISLSIPRENIYDKKLYDYTGARAGRGDLGYLGTDMVLPYKSSKLHKLTKKQKVYNKAHSKVRIVVGHVFGQWVLCIYWNAEMVNTMIPIKHIVAAALFSL